MPRFIFLYRDRKIGLDRGAAHPAAVAAEAAGYIDAYLETVFCVDLFNHFPHLALDFARQSRAENAVHDYVVFVIQLFRAFRREFQEKHRKAVHVAQEFGRDHAVAAVVALAAHEQNSSALETPLYFLRDRLARARHQRALRYAEFFYGILIRRAHFRDAQYPFHAHSL